MKKLTFILALALAGAVYAEPAPAAKPDSGSLVQANAELAATVKERDALKAELAATKHVLENTKKEAAAWIASYQDQVKNLSVQLATAETNLRLTTAALVEAQKKP